MLCAGNIIVQEAPLDIVSGPVAGKQDDDSDANSTGTPVGQQLDLCLKPAGKSSGADLSPIRKSTKKKDFTPGSTDSDNLPLTTLVGRMHCTRTEEEPSPEKTMPQKRKAIRAAAAQAEKANKAALKVAQAAKKANVASMPSAVTSPMRKSARTNKEVTGRRKEVAGKRIRQVFASRGLVIEPRSKKRKHA